jgi:hypothetical protein
VVALELAAAEDREERELFGLLVTDETAQRAPYHQVICLRGIVVRWRG